MTIDLGELKKVKAAELWKHEERTRWDGLSGEIIART